MLGNSWGASWGAFPNCTWGESWGSDVPDALPTTGYRSDANYLSWWEREWDRIREERKRRLKKKVPKKQRVELEKLDEILLEIRAREDAKRMDELRSLEAFMQTAATLDDLRRHVQMAEALLREMDDEEAIIALALH